MFFGFAFKCSEKILLRRKRFSWRQRRGTTWSPRRRATRRTRRTWRFGSSFALLLLLALLLRSGQVRGRDGLHFAAAAVLPALGALP